MVPIRELLNRIRWDPEFGRGNFELGYFDRMERRTIIVRFREVAFPQDDPAVFRLTDMEGQSHPCTAFGKSTRIASAFGIGRRTENERSFCRSTLGGLATMVAAIPLLRKL